jgi:hypothetical protein
MITKLTKHVKLTPAELESIWVAIYPLEEEVSRANIYVSEQFAAIVDVTALDQLLDNLRTAILHAAATHGNPTIWKQ